MPTDNNKSALIIGAGLVGSLTACYLAKAGWRVEVRERRTDPRAQGYAGGRSINLALSVRGLAGLKGVGLDEAVMREDAIRMPGRMIHPTGASGAEVKTYFQPYSANPNDAINSVSRGGLNISLLHAAAKYPNVRLVFDSACADMDLSKPEAVFVEGFRWPLAAGAEWGKVDRVKADLIVCTDGAFSVARGAMMKTDRYEYSQTYLHHGYKELTILPKPARMGGESEYALEPHALHIWPRGGSMMIALPNRDKSFTCTLFWPFEGDHSFGALRSGADVAMHFAKHYPDAAPLMPTLLEDYQRNHVGSLVTVRCWPWQHGGKVALVGDSCHAIVPFYGQGMNCGFEDCLTLAECLERHPADQPAALDEYQRLRKPNADAIAEMALTNFIEMRDLSGRADFQHRKKIERAIYRKMPEKYVPQYDLVSFSTVPYTEALRRGNEMNEAVTRVERILPLEAGKGLNDSDMDVFMAENAGQAGI